MGKHARIAQLEREVLHWRKQAEIHIEVMDYIRNLAELPEDAVLTHNIGNQPITHFIGKSARILLAKIAPR